MSTTPERPYFVGEAVVIGDRSWWPVFQQMGSYVRQERVANSYTEAMQIADKLNGDRSAWVKSQQAAADSQELIMQISEILLGHRGGTNAEILEALQDCKKLADSYNALID